MVAPVGFGKKPGRRAKQLFSAPHGQRITASSCICNPVRLTDSAGVSSLGTERLASVKERSAHMKRPPKPKASITSETRIGPAGWSYADWNGYVYPSRRSKGFHEAAYLSEFFDTIEINTSFYQPLKPEHAALWIERVAANPAFLFTAKVWQKFTHDPSATLEDERAVRPGFDVLRAAEKLGALLLQFPFSFHCTPETVAYLSAVLKRFADYPLVVELRHASWQTPDTFELLREHNAGFCNIDQPVIGKSVVPSSEATSPIGYVRLHGRRYDTWFDDNPATAGHERYNYLYSKEELEPWAERIEKVRSQTRKTFVVTNNHYQGKAVVNALQLISILKREKVKVPDPLREHYPELEKIADRMPAAPTLFAMGMETKKKAGR